MVRESKWYDVEPPLPMIWQQNQRRAKPVPKQIIQRLIEKLEPPTWAECAFPLNDRRVSCDHRRIDAKNIIAALLFRWIDLHRCRSNHRFLRATMSSRTTSLLFFVVLSFALSVVVPFFAGDKKDDGFVPMFNGKDLTGWVNVNCAPGSFFVKDGEIITTGKPTGDLRPRNNTRTSSRNSIGSTSRRSPAKVGNSGFFVWCDPLPAVGTGYSRHRSAGPCESHVQEQEG